MSFLSSLFGLGKSSLKEAFLRGALVIDVRNAYQYDNGRIPGSINIPAALINSDIERIRDIKKPIIICSDSGFESARIVGILKQAGIKDVYNGGSWESLLRKLK